MKKLSLKRIIMFSRLQVTGIYGKNIWKILGLATSLPVILVLISFLFSGQDTGDAVGFSETSIIICGIILFPLAMLNDYTSPDSPVKRVMVPASGAEKFISVYVTGFLLGIAFICYASLIGSAIFRIDSIIAGTDSAEGFRMLIFSEGAEKGDRAGQLVGAAYMLLMIMWFIQLYRTRKTVGVWRVWLALAFMVLCVAIPAIIMDIIPEDTVPDSISFVILACVMVLTAAAATVWSYRLFIRTQLYKNNNDRLQTGQGHLCADSREHLR